MKFSKTAFIFAASLSLVLLTSSLAFAQTCDMGQTKGALRKALYEYFGNPSTSTLTSDQIRALLEFYISIPTGQSQASCDASISSSVQSASNINKSVPLCPDGTEYGACSQSKPLMCYSGSLVSKCGICGCPSSFSCDVFSGKCRSGRSVQTTYSTTTTASSTSVPSTIPINQTTTTWMYENDTCKLWINGEEVPCELIPPSTTTTAPVIANFHCQDDPIIFNQSGTEPEHFMLAYVKTACKDDMGTHWDFCMSEPWDRKMTYDCNASTNGCSLLGFGLIATGKCAGGAWIKVNSTHCGLTHQIANTSYFDKCTDDAGKHVARGCVNGNVSSYFRCVDSNVVDVASSQTYKWCMEFGAAYMNWPC
jgi:hypothetical protein